MKTLDNNSARIHKSLVKMQSGCLTDLRGKYKAWNKGAYSIKAHVMQHIESFPTLLPIIADLIQRKNNL